MWVLVLDAVTGRVITNASFSIAYYNRGDGNYYVYFSSYNQAFTCSAPGHYTLWGNDDTYASMTVWLTPQPTTPPPPPPPNCWS
ncbi:hypothetical protein SAMN04489717_3717 [Actinopolymorpha singaporensis]|uniref:Uncharacterized protein n=1 Tax=Actinopolymorpha singaporensis TaxID=117157 RepID=A0A1H1UPD9_9ACTN|nr:hypothetical protein SAMN04489717_3717 [Actinopolymorpha singaporensis]